MQMQLSQKQKPFSQFFAIFLKSGLTSEILKTKINLKAFVFPKLQTPKTWLDKCLNIPVSENTLTINMVKVPKHCWNLHHRPCFKLIDHCQVNWVGKSLSYWHENPWDCLLTHWLLMRSILFLIETMRVEEGE